MTKNEMLTMFDNLMHNADKKYLVLFNQFAPEVDQISYSEFQYILIIEYNEEIFASDIAKILNVTNPAVTYVINTLIEKGYVYKVEDKVDKRKKVLSVSQKYKDIGNKIDNYLFDDFYNSMSENELKLLSNILIKANKALDKI